MDPHPKGGNIDVGRDINREIANEVVLTDEKNILPDDPEKGGVFVNEKSSHNETSDSSEDGHVPHVYELDNMVRDEKGNIVVETSELAVTVLHVDDDPTLSPWTFRTFFLGISVDILEETFRLMFCRCWTCLLWIGPCNILHVQATVCLCLYDLLGPHQLHPR